ncbi:hypothetical protein [Pedococcus sp.]|uniref:hypothetical protein n=1 Tax=Pedococcus sp. TaxID=2860345 RepID=UPI002E103BCB|nr:hypothetical protein [Pedococcus sp.]
MHKVLGTAALTTVICCLAAPALAAPGASLAVSPSSQHAGGSVQVSGTCEAGTSGFAISSAFVHDATHDFAGVGAAPFTTDSQGRFATTAMIASATTPGSYTVSARCGGGNIGVTATVMVTSRSSVPSAPTQVPAGTGGLAATGSGTTPLELELAALGGALVLAGGVGLARRSRR